MADQRLFLKSIVILAAASLMPISSVSARSKTATPRPPVDGFARRLLERLDVTTPLRVWPAGSVLSGCFMAGSPSEQQLFVDATKVWTEHANITFDFGAAAPYRRCMPNEPVAQVRVLIEATSTKLGRAGAANLGTQAVDQPALRRTVEISSINTTTRKPTPHDRLKHTMIHELGHVLGLPHEHQHPDSPCFEVTKWPEICKGRDGLSLGTPLSIASFARLNYAPRTATPGVPVVFYDPASIMHYKWAAKNFTVPLEACVGKPALELSKGDKALIARLYPKDLAEQQRLILSRAVALRQQIFSLKGMTLEQAQRVAAGAEALVKNGHPDLGFKIDLTGFVATPVLPLPNSQWTVAQRLELGRGIEVATACPPQPRTPIVTAAPAAVIPMPPSAPGLPLLKAPR